MKEQLPKLRKQARNLIKRRQKAEEIALRRGPMVSASFCKRKSGMLYLSASIDGESRHRYVRKSESDYWEKRAKEWKIFSKAIAKWVVLNREIEKLIREIGRMRTEPLPEKRLKRGEK